MLLVEHESREGYEAYDFMEALEGSAIPTPRKAPDLPVSDPFAEDPSVIGLPLSQDSSAVLEGLSSELAVPARQILEEAINLRWILKQAADKSLDVLLEATAEDEYIAVPTTFVD